MVRRTLGIATLFGSLPRPLNGALAIHWAPLLPKVLMHDSAQVMSHVPQNGKETPRNWIGWKCGTVVTRLRGKSLHPSNIEAFHCKRRKSIEGDADASERQANDDRIYQQDRYFSSAT